MNDLFLSKGVGEPNCAGVGRIRRVIVEVGSVDAIPASESMNGQSLKDLDHMGRGRTMLWCRAVRG